LRKRTGKNLFVELEKRVCAYHDKYEDRNGRASTQRFEGKYDDLPPVPVI